MMENRISIARQESSIKRLSIIKGCAIERLHT